MGIEKPNTIDFISTAVDGEIRLTISDHLEWDRKNEHLLKLQDKLNSYLKFIESGEIYESYPNAKGQKISIELVMLHRPDEEALIFLHKSQQTIAVAGFSFSWRQQDLNATA